MNPALIAVLLICTADVLEADPPPIAPAVSPALISSAPSDPLSEALPILKQDYADFPALNYKPGDTLPDLIARSNGKLIVEAVPTTPPPPMFSAELPGNVGYWRLASFTPQKDWAQFAAELKNCSDHDQGAILDLRTNSTDDYSGAAQLLGFFDPMDSALYRYLPHKDGVLPLSNHAATAVYTGPLVVLTNGQTAGAAETLANRLQADGALVVGRSTASAQPAYEEHALSGGQVLRIQLPIREGTSPAATGAVVPDITLAVDDRNEKASLTLIRDDRIGDVVQESTARPRLNEAALVADQDPEWDAYLSSLERKPVLLSLPRIHDPVLTAALDSVRAIRLSARAPLETGAADPAPAAAATGSMQ